MKLLLESCHSLLCIRHGQCYWKWQSHILLMFAYHVCILLKLIFSACGSWALLVCNELKVILPQSVGSLKHMWESRLILAHAWLSLVIFQLCSCYHLHVLSFRIQLPETELKPNCAIIQDNWSTIFRQVFYKKDTIVVWQQHHSQLAPEMFEEFQSNRRYQPFDKHYTYSDHTKKKCMKIKLTNGLSVTFLAVLKPLPIKKHQHFNHLYFPNNDGSKNPILWWVKRTTKEITVSKPLSLNLIRHTQTSGPMCRSDLAAQVDTAQDHRWVLVQQGRRLVPGPRWCPDGPPSERFRP